MSRKQADKHVSRQLSHRVKSISASLFTNPEVSALVDGGNAKATRIWLAKWTAKDYPLPAHGDLDLVKEFIRQKYVRRRWVDEALLKSLNPPALTPNSPQIRSAKPGALRPPNTYLPRSPTLGHRRPTTAFSSAASSPASKPKLLPNPPPSNSTQKSVQVVQGPSPSTVYPSRAPTTTGLSVPTQRTLTRVRSMPMLKDPPLVSLTQPLPQAPVMAITNQLGQVHLSPSNLPTSMEDSHSIGPRNPFFSVNRTHTAPSTMAVKSNSDATQDLLGLFDPLPTPSRGTGVGTQSVNGPGVQHPASSTTVGQHMISSRSTPLVSQTQQNPFTPDSVSGQFTPGVTANPWYHQQRVLHPAPSQGHTIPNVGIPSSFSQTTTAAPLSTSAMLANPFTRVPISAGPVRNPFGLTTARPTLNPTTVGPGKLTPMAPTFPAMGTLPTGHANQPWAMHHGPTPPTPVSPFINGSQPQPSHAGTFVNGGMIGQSFSQQGMPPISTPPATTSHDPLASLNPFSQTANFLTNNFSNGSKYPGVPPGSGFTQHQQQPGPTLPGHQPVGMYRMASH
ncbi:hypothetical protein IWQ61_004363 [Dispira simplex]|nr:hypothetical protein IWQ61_004363 [Dispira simplex]